jgi:hypothetical protein
VDGWRKLRATAFVVPAILAAAAVAALLELLFVLLLFEVNELWLSKLPEGLRRSWEARFSSGGW